MRSPDGFFKNSIKRRQSHFHRGASKGIKRDYFAVDWITDFPTDFPASSSTHRINFHGGINFTTEIVREIMGKSRYESSITETREEKNKPPTELPTV